MNSFARPSAGAALLASLLAAPPDGAAACAPADRALLAEIYYDAAGDDTGYEFVELFNPTAHGVGLAGVRLEAGDGADPGPWTLRWTGAPGDSVAPGGRFVVGGARVTPPANAVVTLALQNGPDAVRLVWPDGAIEVVGYGALTDPAQSCDAPAPDAAAGQSLARVPDDADLGGNALDFRAATPSPGRANLPRRDGALEPGTLRLEPERPQPGFPSRLAAQVKNAGAGTLESGEARLRALARDGLGERVVAEQTLEPALAPGDTAHVELALPGLPAGITTLVAALDLAGDEDTFDDRDSLRVRVGAGPFALNEIQFHPAHGEGEWVELEAWTQGPVDLGPWTLADRSGTVATVHAQARRVDEGGRIVLAMDRRALLLAHPTLDSLRVFSATPWPSLNNSNDASGIADVLTLREPDGTLADRVAYGASGVPAGVPLERLAGDHWAPAGDADGTPLEPPRLLPPLGARFAVHPARVPPGAASRMDWSLPWAWARVSIEAFDLAGRSLGTVVGESLRPGRGGATWDATGWPPGVCVLQLRARPESGDGLVTATALMRLDRGR